VTVPLLLVLTIPIPPSPTIPVILISPLWATSGVPIIPIIPVAIPLSILPPPFLLGGTLKLYSLPLLRLLFLLLRLNLRIALLKGDLGSISFRQELWL
jgi:hypothetical protein